MISHETFNIICIIWIAIACITFPVVLKVPQPYGRHSKQNWGPMVNNRLGWFLMEFPALGVFGYFLIIDNPDFLNKIIIVAAILWGLHYFNRVFIFPVLIRTAHKQMPVLIVVLAIFFNSVNGFLNGYWLSHFAIGQHGTFIDFRLGIGIIIFLSGFAINKYHDRLLINLRSSAGSGYKIPYGGLFKYVSCPNFLGEIITWLGFFIVTFSLPAFSFLIWTTVNLTARALDHHKWYKREFTDYPVERKAILPFIL